MKEIIYSLTWFSGIVILTHCGSVREFQPETYNGNYIVVGNGGGFTGKTTSYYLLSSGELYKGSEFSNELSYQGKLERSFVDQQWNIFREQSLSSKEMNDPGNFYYFLKYHYNDEQHNFMWHTLEKDLQILETIYLNINQKINTLTDSQYSKK